MARVRFARIPLLAAACCACLPALGWKDAWHAVLEPGVERASVKGVCSQGGVAYVSAVNSTNTTANPVAVVYAIAPLAGAPQPKALWKGGDLRYVDDLTEPICDGTGISFGLHAKGSQTLDWVRIDAQGKELGRRRLAITDKVAAARAFPDGRVLLVANQGVWVMDRAGALSPLAMEGADEDVILDACALPNGPALLTMSIKGAAPEMRLRRWNGNRVADTATLGGAFGSLRCAGANEPVEAVFLQMTTPVAGNFFRARIGPAAGAIATDKGPQAAIASLSSRGAASRWGPLWAFGNFKMPHVYAWAANKAPELLWRDDDPKRGGTTEPPSIVVLDRGVLVVHESVDRAAPGLPTVLRAVLLEP